MIFYNKVFDELNKYGIEPLVTISHYELPYALVEKYNGWYGREVIECFARYALTLFERYKDKENGITIQKGPGDDKLLRQGTIDFYTFSYYMSVCESADPAVTAKAGGNLVGGVEALLSGGAVKRGDAIIKVL